jgi:hypothetical protein
MNLKNDANKLFTNKYFLYFMLFLSFTNIVGYLTMNKIDTVIFFALISLLVYHFSKNMSIVLLIALVITNLLMVNRYRREGMDNSNTSEDDDKLESVDPELNAGVKDIKKTKNPSQTKNNLKMKKEQELKENAQLEQSLTNDTSSNDNTNDTTSSSNDTTSSTNDTTSSTNEGFNQPVPQGVATNAKKVGKNSSSRIDYSSTLEQSYDNLDKMLGSDGINKLTQDTQRLMSQQQKLFSTMQSMAPMLQDAKKMMQGFDLKGLGLSDLASKFNAN